MPHLRSVVVSVSLLALALLAGLCAITLLGPGAQRVEAAAIDLLLSEYVEGSSTNKALEVFNGTAAPVVLDGAYDIQIYANGSASATATIPLAGTIAPGGAFVLARAGAAADLVSRADRTTSNFLFSSRIKR